MLEALWGDWSVWRAAKKARPDKLHELLAVELQPEVVVNRMHPVRGITPLMAATNALHTTSVAECVQILISYGADVTAADNTKHRNTVLHYAACNNKATAIGELLDAGANIFARNRYGHTALDVAWMHGRREAARALMEHIQLHSGWLGISSKVAVPRWKRRWCVVLASDSDSSSVEFCVFHQPDQVRPHKILKFNAGTSIVVPTWSVVEFHVDGVKVQSLRQRFGENKVAIEAKSNQRHHTSGYRREFAFASETSDTSNDRQMWVGAFQVCGRGRVPRVKQRPRPHSWDASRHSSDGDTNSRSSTLA
ncbi:hypothetical protein PHYBOEH_010854 [Phytophthora boehmeriae]|uniref:Ankyrin repeat domain-containing protein n=1 Tax=Phytophthora boehmeriae TaxID=109152 RepID=A0A8T1X4L9_9STRA|nr:hypothetical protein PHYBOEH_010854 [Phytophthora boehmeriae]